MTNPVTRHFTINKLLQGYPEEVLYQLELAREFIFHIGVEPRDGVLLQGLIPNPDTLSTGSARPDIAPVAPTDAEQSLGVRLWSSCQQVVDDVYGEPVNGEWIYKAPIRTMGYVEYNADANSDISYNEFGQVITRTARMWIPLIHHIENGLSYPKVGDVVEFWGRSWHEFGVFYDVVKSSPDGYINDTDYFVQWILELRRNDVFVPERKVLAASDGTSEPAQPTLPPIEDPEGGDASPSTVYNNEAICVTSASQYTYTLAHQPITTLDIDVHWNGINLIPGAGFNTYLPNVGGFVIQSGLLVISDSVELMVDDVISVGYSYLSDG